VYSAWLCLCDDVGGGSPQIAIVMGNFTMPSMACSTAQRRGGETRRRRVVVVTRCVLDKSDFITCFLQQHKKPGWLVARVGWASSSAPGMACERRDHNCAQPKSAARSGHSSYWWGVRQVRLDLVCLFSNVHTTSRPPLCLPVNLSPSYKLPPALALLPLLHCRPPLSPTPRLQFIYRY
jgi:hypothetical protein